jgi:hypothetical protein
MPFGVTDTTNREPVRNRFMKCLDWVILLTGFIFLPLRVEDFSFWFWQFSWKYWYGSLSPDAQKFLQLIFNLNCFAIKYLICNYRYRIEYCKVSMFVYYLWTIVLRTWMFMYLDVLTMTFADKRSAVNRLPKI